MIAASHRDLEAAVVAGTFREDLLARLAGYTLEVPPLRERREDIGLLARALLARVPQAKTLRLSPEAGFALLRYDWPRNVRELEQVLTTACTLASEGVIERDHLPRALSTSAEPEATSEDLSPSEPRRRDELRTLLASHRGNLAAVARAMGVARVQIHRWLERYAIDPDEYRKPS